jgi:WD40 repeat protein
MARVFEARTGREVLRMAHQRAVYGVAFNVDGRLLATGSEDGTVRLYHVRSGLEIGLP